jgi:hypothetical protein
MAQHIGSSEWINAYLEWTNTEFSTAAKMSLASGMDLAEDIATAYLEWIDAPPAKERRALGASAAEPQREAVLLLALRTESECMHIVRQALDSGLPTSQTMQLALEALECAKSLLESERRAWQTLSALRVDDRSERRISWKRESGMDWPGALASVEADVRALSGRIFELRAH